MANCSYNLESNFEHDCVGNTGKTFAGPNHHEVRVVMGFIDGTNAVVDEHGYKTVYKPIVNRGAWGKTYAQIKREQGL